MKNFILACIATVCVFGFTIESEGATFFLRRRANIINERIDERGDLVRAQAQLQRELNRANQIQFQNQLQNQRQFQLQRQLDLQRQLQLEQQFQLRNFQFNNQFRFNNHNDVFRNFNNFHNCR